MTRPAAPLEKAVAAAREALAIFARDEDIETYKLATIESIEALRILLAAIDADKRLEEAEARLARIDAWAGERCEASGCRPDPCGPVEYHDVEGVPLCAECWQECVDEAEDARRESAEKGDANG